MLELSKIESALTEKLNPRRALGFAIGLNLLLLILALVLPADGEARSPILLSILGNFHILALHLPAALLLIVPLFELLERHEQASHTVRRLSVISAAGTWAAVLLGIFHAHYNGYAGSAIQLHLWGGLAASACASVAALALSRGFKIRLATQILAVGVMGFAAHIGGELVHADGFPFKPNKAAAPKAIAPDRLVTISQKRDDYSQVIRPILDSHCVACHGPKKIKGKLRLDSLDGFQKGGAEGVVFVAGNLAKSPMYTRLLLPRDDDEAMPPKDEKQLSKAQITAIGLWIEGKPIPDDLAKATLVETKSGK